MDLYTIRKKINMGMSISSLDLRVVFYARVSTDHLDQQNSLHNQKDYFINLIKKNKHWEFVSGYIDEGISGTSVKKRNSFLKMLDDAKNNKFDLIVTKEISRFSRNTLDSIKYTRELLSYGVAVLFVNDNINTALSDSELRLTIMASMAQDEIRRLSERVKFGMNQAINKGTVLGNDMLYGYKKNHNTGNLFIISNEASIVKRMYNLYGNSNYSINKIVKLLNSEGYKTRQNNKWCISTISRMLKNPKYKGYYCGKKSEIIDYMSKKVKKNLPREWVIYKDTIRIPPIVDEKLWNKVNKKLNRHIK